MKKIQKALALLLALCVVAALSPAAFAADYYYDTDDSDNVTETLGDLTGSAGGGTVLEVYPYTDGTITVNAGNVTTEGSGSRYGIMAEAYDDNAIANVTAGDVSVISDSGYVEAVYAEAYPDSYGTDTQVNVTVGDVYAKGTSGWIEAIDAESYYGGVTNVTAGDLTAESTETTADGIYMDVEGDGSAATVTAGNVVARGDGEAYGVYAFVERWYDEDESVVANLNLDSVSATTTSDTAYGLYLQNYGGNINAQIAGDVSAEDADWGYGLYLYLYGYGESMTDTLVDGTLSGSTSAVYLDGYSDEGKLTVWKATLNEGGTVVDGYYQDECEAFEQNILYIIKMDEAAQGQIGLSGTTQSHERDCAREGELVTLKTPSGATVTNNGVMLEKDANGNYFLIVPKGGGVYLRLEVLAVAAAPVESNVVALLDVGEGIGLRLLEDGSYVLRLADGVKLYGTYAFEDGVPVFTTEDGTVITAERNEDGLYTFALPYGEGQTVRFTISAEKLARLIAVRG